MASLPLSILFVQLALNLDSLSVIANLTRKTRVLCVTPCTAFSDGAGCLVKEGRGRTIRYLFEPQTVHVTGQRVVC